MADQRITVRVNDAVLADLSALETATGLSRAEVVRVAVSRLASAYAFLADKGYDLDGYVSDGGAILTMPVRRQPR